MAISTCECESGKKPFKQCHSSKTSQNGKQQSNLQVNPGAVALLTRLENAIRKIQGGGARWSSAAAGGCLWKAQKIACFCRKPTFTVRQAQIGRSQKAL